MTHLVHLRLDHDERAIADTIERAARAALKACQVNDGEITVALTDNTALRTLNRDHRGFDQATDVLSFPMDEVDPDSGLPYLGDIVISLEMAAEQAADEGHLLSAELTLLTVHGVLHLLGHDHETPDGKQEMWRLQSEVLASLGNEILGPAEP